MAYVPGNHDLWVDRPWGELLGDPELETWKRHDLLRRALHVLFDEQLIDRLGHLDLGGVERRLDQPHRFTLGFEAVRLPLIACK